MKQRFVLLSLLLSGGKAESADTVIAALMRRAAPEVEKVSTLKKTTVTEQLDLVVALGARKNVWSPQPDFAWWNATEALGLFLQQRSDPALVYKLLIQRGRGESDCYARVERITASDVVISCRPEKGNDRTHRKLLYDVRAKASVGEVDYDVFALHRIFQQGDTAILVGSDRRKNIVLEYAPGREPAFTILTGHHADRWTRRVGVTPEALYMQPEPHKEVRFGSGERFALTEDAGRKQVVERTGKNVKAYPLPQSTFDTFAKARPPRVQNGYSREHTEIDEAVGAWQLADGELWFAKTFYDGEGHTGVGGFGYFDTQARSYRMFSPPELAAWSVSAMLVESDAVWLGLAHCGEWGTTSGGLLRFDRKSEQISTFPSPDVLNKIVRVGEHILLATEAGAAVVENSEMRRFFVDPLSDGRLRIAEALP